MPHLLGRLIALLRGLCCTRDIRKITKMDVAMARIPPADDTDDLL